jgi:hypothetical protein
MIPGAHSPVCFEITGIEENPAKYPPYPEVLYPPLIPAVTALLDSILTVPLLLQYHR